MTNSFKYFAGIYDLLNGDREEFESRPEYARLSVSPTSLNPGVGDPVFLERMIGLSSLIYGENGSVTQSGTLPKKNSTITVNGRVYVVVDLADDVSGYQGLILFDQISNSIVVVNRGSQTSDDFGSDAEMAFNTTSSQWNAARIFGAQVASDAASLGATSIYTTGHSLGGTLAQMLASYYGWQGYTFNAYGAGDIYNRLGLSFAAGAQIFNYRTMFDLVSDASTQLGYSPVTIPTAADAGLLSGAFALFNPMIISPGLLSTIAADHSIDNFHEAGDPKGSYAAADNTFKLSSGFYADPPPSPQLLAMVEDFLAGLAEMIHLGIESIPGVGSFQSGNLSLAQSAQELMQFIDNEPVSGIQSIVPSDQLMLAKALDPAAANNAYRAALVALSPTILQGLDPSSYINANLWMPGLTAGLTKEYLSAKNDMLQAMITLAGNGLTGGTMSTGKANTYLYFDLAKSANPFYTLNGNSGNTYDIVFADGTGESLAASAGAYGELFGGAGDDTLFGGTVSSTLQGGQGNDDYVVNGGGSGIDSILDTDGHGVIEWLIDGVRHALTGGSDMPGTAAWKSTDGLFTYFEELAADGSTELEIIGGGKTAYVDDFSNGEFGITLDAPTAPTTPSGTLQVTAQNSFTPGLISAIEFDDSGAQVPVASTLLGPTDTSGSIWAINGIGNASAIYGGVGSELLLADSRSLNSVTGIEDTLSFYILAGDGAQSIIGAQGHDTLIGGSDTVSSVSKQFDAGTGPAPGNGSAYVMQGKAGFDWITGGGGDDLIEAGTGSALIDGGTGSDTIYGGAGNDSIFAGLSYYSDGQADDAVFDIFDADGVLSDVWTQGIGGSTFAGMSEGGSAKSNRITAGTGNDFIMGGLGSDTIYGGSGTDTIIGNSGADVIYGGAGNSILYADENVALQSASGIAWQSAGSADSNTIVGGDGNDTIYGSGGSDYLYGGGGDNQIFVGNGNSYVNGDGGNVTILGGSGNEQIELGDGNDEVTLGSGNSHVIAGQGQSTIWAGTGQSTIDVGGGQNTVIGGTGTISLIVAANSGADAIQRGSGAISLQMTNGLDESNLVIRNVDGDLVLTDPGFGTHIEIDGYFSDASGVTLQFADGATWGASQILQASMAPSNGYDDTLVGSSGDDSITAGYGDTLIIGASGDNTLTGGAGDDTIQGGSGSDTIEGGSGNTQIAGGSGHETYLFQIGDGSSTITGNTSAGANDELKFGSGISADDLTFSRGASPDDLLISFGTLSSSTITISDFLDADPEQHQVGGFTFADGSQLTQLQVIQRAVAIDGSSAGEELDGTAGADYFDGKGGSDYEVGGGGNDTFVFDAGYGSLGIESILAEGQASVLQLGPGISVDDLSVTTNGNTLFLTDGVQDDQIALYGMWTDGSEGVTSVQLADGTSLTRAELIAIAFAHTSSDSDNLIGSSGADYIDGKGGTDSEEGGGGSDTFVFDAGYGRLDIYNPYNDGDVPVLKLGAGITTSNITVTTNGFALYLADGVAGDRVTLEKMWNTTDFGVAEVVFANGDVLTRAQLVQIELSSATSGSDTLYGSAGDDLIDGKGGGDYVIGEGGNDTIVFNVGYGNLEVNNSFGADQLPILSLGPGISSSDLRVTTNDTSLFLKVDAAGDLVTFDNMWSSSNAGVAAVKLSDGTLITRSQLIQLELNSGTTASDTLRGTSGADYIDGKGGGDEYIGDGGNDTFVFNRGYGSLDIFNQRIDGDSPVVQLGTGITLSNLRVTTNGNAIFLTDGLGGDKVTLDLMWSDGGWGVDSVRLSDGTSLSLAQLRQMEMNGTSGSDTIYGTSSSEVLDGAGGSDVISGAGGADTFVYKSGYGHLEINENYQGGQAVLSLGADISVSDLHVTIVGTNLQLTDGVAGDSVTLDNLWSTFYGPPAVSAVLLADGTSLTSAQLIQMEIAGGTTGSDTIIGTTAGEYLDGKGGDDVVSGNGGNDTFVFHAGYGHLDISNTFANGEQPVLELGPGITAASLNVSADDQNNLYISDGVSGDQIELSSMWYSLRYGTYNYGVQSVQLTDGTTLSLSQLLQMEVSGGTTGDDTIYGTAGADLFDGKGGNDVEIGNGGNDTSVFDLGYGLLSIQDNDGGGAQPVLRLGAGLVASELTITTTGTDLILANHASGDQITLVNAAFAGYGPQTVEFADGSSMTADQLRQMAATRIMGSSGNDSLLDVGIDKSSYFDGKGGNDIAYGDFGNDTFVFNAGYGHLEIDEPISAGWSPVLQLGSGITLSSIHAVSPDGNDVYLTDGVDGDQIILDGEYGDNGAVGVGVVQFSGGATLTRDQIIWMIRSANLSAGDDTVVGTGSAELIDGKGGVDREAGQGGNDTFVFNAGYGQLDIYEHFLSGQAPVLQLGAGINASDIQVTTNGNDLFVTDGTSGDQIQIEDMDVNPNAGVQSVVFSDGTSMTAAQLLAKIAPGANQAAHASDVASHQVNALIHAMASFSSNGSGLANQPLMGAGQEDHAAMLHAASASG